ncbi:hypothetical protein ABI59_09260 [Acidobacteria bacterium Mor1]|nr:hypothetical protein ABI59_09260 [Acidobacteria bacterium Mor1]
MRTMTNTGLLCGLLTLAILSTAAQTPPEWTAEGPRVHPAAASFEVPVEVSATKLYVDVELGGKTRRFVVDTGSPSMIDRKIVEELDLPTVGTSKGRDAHGAVIESSIVQASLTLGGVRFDKVPMFAADFSSSPVTRAFIGDGVLGSELLPLGAWQMDLRQSMLRFSTDASRLPHVKKATKVKLDDFGYPHYPYLDVRFDRDARSKAMFDTGAPTYFTISPPDLAGTERAGGIGRTLTGYGSPGGSLGGQAPAGEQQLVELKALSIDKLKLGRVVAGRRDAPPSLIGARLLERFIVTFDSAAGLAYFTPYGKGDLPSSTFGFTLAFDQRISVGVVWNGTPAHKAGLRAGMPLTSIDGRATQWTPEGLRRALAAMAKDEITVTWEGGSATLQRSDLRGANRSSHAGCDHGQLSVVTLLVALHWNEARLPRRSLPLLSRPQLLS